MGFQFLNEKLWKNSLEISPPPLPHRGVKSEINIEFSIVSMVVWQTSIIVVIIALRFPFVYGQMHCFLTEFINIL